MTTEKPCNPHPDAPHGFVRNASHSVGHYVCECSGWTPPTLQELLRSVGKDYDFHDNALVYKAADRIDLDASHIATLAKVVDKLQTERDELRVQYSDALGQISHLDAKQGVLRAQVAALADDKEVLLGHMTTIRHCTNDPSIAILTRLVLERMAQGGGK